MLAPLLIYLFLVTIITVLIKYFIVKISKKHCSESDSFQILLFIWVTFIWSMDFKIFTNIMDNHLINYLWSFENIIVNLCDLFNIHIFGILLGVIGGGLLFLPYIFFKEKLSRITKVPNKINPYTIFFSQFLMSNLIISIAILALLIFYSLN
jgi:hypothetical protein